MNSMNLYIKLIFATALIIFQSNILLGQEPSYLWHRGYSDCSSGSVESQILTPNNDLYILVTHSSALDTDPSVYDSMPARGWTLIKYDNQRRYLWHRSFSSIGASAMSIKMDNYENVFIYGTSNENYDADPGAGFFSILAGGSVTKIGPDGQFFWAKQLQIGVNQALTAMAIDPNNNLYFTGKYSGNLDVDPSAATYILPNLSGSRAFVVKWDNDGNFEMAFPLNNPSSITPFDLEAYDNKVFLSGSLSNQTDMDPSPGNAMI